MAAALGYAERWCYEVVFWEEPSSSWEHKGSQFRVKTMFPSIRVLSEEERRKEWVAVKEPWDSIFTYNPLPNVGGRNIKLEGYFQSDLYGPSTFPTPPSPPALSAELIPHRWSNTFFLHVRRGDYLHPANAHHAVNLTEYWRTCLREMSADGSGSTTTCFVVSDDMAWCRRELLGIVGDCWKGDWLWCPEGLSDVETFFWMRACEKGGICANSTFSWWAAWYLRRRVQTCESLAMSESSTSLASRNAGRVGSAATIYMPRIWGYPPLPPTRNLHPAWALVR